MTNITTATEVQQALTEAGWTPTPRWATPEERAKCDLVVLDLSYSHEVHVVGGPGGSGVFDVIADLEAAGIRAVRRGIYAVVNAK